MNINDKKAQLEVEKLIEDIILTRKKNLWYEVAIILSGTAVIITFTKLFL